MTDLISGIFIGLAIAGAVYGAYLFGRFKGKRTQVIKK